MSRLRWKPGDLIELPAGTLIEKRGELIELLEPVRHRIKRVVPAMEAAAGTYWPERDRLILEYQNPADEWRAYPTESGEPFTFELEEGEWTRLDGTFEDIAGAEATAKEGRRAARLRALKEGGAA